ncbi:hypothetical protein AB6A40_002416 [Gnathostoma spinigerum]|uniref:Dynein heavy chain tail domain-containing protein n=1 Tax=Gnathostoma spinigerum TaxID=75299 RepID=A0ABD6EG92_9BILA
MTDSESDRSVAAPPTAEVNLVDVATFTMYIKRCFVGCDPVALDEALKASSDCLQEFILNPQVAMLVVDRTIVRDANTDESGDESITSIRVANEIIPRTERTSSLIMLKGGSIIEADKAIEDQLYVMRLPESNPYDILLSLFGKVGTPFFKSLIKDSGRGERDGDKLALSIEKNLTEVEVGLLHMQQNIDIPEIDLAIHPAIQAAIQRAAESGRKAKVADLGDMVEDSAFLNALQKGVSRWIKEIQKVTKLERDPASGTSLQEMTFWQNLERALLKITEKRESDEVMLTLEALKCGKRFHATVSFDADTGLKQAMTLVNDYNVLMKDIPLNEMMAATDMGAIRIALTNIFSHMKKLRNTKYPIARALRFVEAISKDVYTQMLKVLGTRRLMNIPLADFEELMTQCFAVFNTWSDEYDKLSTIMRDLSKKKRDEQLKLTWRINAQHKKLESRLEQMRLFRRQHEQLRMVISRVLRPVGQENGDETPEGDVEKRVIMNTADTSAIDQVNLAYENVKEVDCLDVSNDGNAAWEAAIRRYEDQIDRVETQITARLRDQLGGAKNADEMFTIFQRFNALFVRPHIRGAIREYQAQLIHRVKEDIDKLQTRFTNFSEDSNARILSTLDIPPLSATIIWIRQIDRRLSQFMKRIEDVLGKGWENHVEGRQLKLEGDNFRQKLNTQPLFEDWVAKIQTKNISLTGRVFTIEKRPKEGRVYLSMKVNFSRDVVTLFKEVRNLKHMGFRIPLKIVNTAHQANLLYPFAISLLESIQTYDSINERISGKTGINLLVATCKKEIQSQLSEGYTLTWESYKLDPYVGKLSETINSYQDKVEELEMVLDRIEVDLAALDTCQYSAPTLAALLTSVQKAVDKLSLGNYSNLHQWVEDIDKQIERKLAARVEEAIRLWTLVLARDELEDESEEKMTLPTLQPVVLEMRVTSQVMYVSPSIEQARAQLLDQLFAWQAVVTNQKRISSRRFQLGLSKDTEEATYRNVLASLPKGQQMLETAYQAVEKVMSEVTEYVGEWLRYQALWDLQPDMLYERLGNDVSKWMRTLVEIRKSRSIFDTQETRKEIFPVIVDYTKVQSKVSLKYDYWHREVLQKFGTSVGGEMQSFYSQISKWRAELEDQSVDAGSTSDAIQLITYVQQLKKKTKWCQEQVEQFRSAQRLLTQQRYQFPSSWLYSENIDGEWSALSDILERKDSAIQSQVCGKRISFNYSSFFL